MIISYVVHYSLLLSENVSCADSLLLTESETESILLPLELTGSAQHTMKYKTNNGMIV